MTWLDDLTLDTVIVHTRDDRSIRGLKAAVYDDCIVLRDAVVLGADAQEVLDGLIPIPRENVAFMQILNSDGAA